MFWIKNTDKKPDAMLTFAFLAFSVVTLNILLATFGQYAPFGQGVQDVSLHIQDAALEQSRLLLYGLKAILFCMIELIRQPKGKLNLIGK